MGPRFSNKSSAVIGALRTFVRTHVDQYCAPDHFVVPIERKGTAILRDVFGDRQEIWNHVISNKQAPDFFANKDQPRILILEDAARTGTSADDLRQEILAKCPSAELQVAAFISLSSSMKHIEHVRYRGLDEMGYKEIRDLVVRHLMKSGSLLLDTEHPEIVANAYVDSETFGQALATWGQTVRYSMHTHGVNFTVCKKFDELVGRFKDIMPVSASKNRAFCKVRVVESPDEEFSFRLVPICFPSIKIMPGFTYAHPRMNWPSLVSHDPESIFHCIGIVLSLECLLDLMESLRDVLGENIRFNYEPSLFLHLKSMLPELDPHEIHTELHRIKYYEAHPQHATGTVDDVSLKLLTEIAEKLRQLCFDRDRRNGTFIRHFDATDLETFARLEGVTLERASAALDFLIDTSQIEPDVLNKNCGKMAKLFWRAFGPEGEFSEREVILSALAAGKGMEVTDDSILDGNDDT